MQTNFFYVSLEGKYSVSLESLKEMTKKQRRAFCGLCYQVQRRTQSWSLLRDNHESNDTRDTKKLMFWLDQKCPSSWPQEDRRSNNVAERLQWKQVNCPLTTKITITFLNVRKKTFSITSCDNCRYNYRLQTCLQFKRLCFAGKHQNEH